MFGGNAMTQRFRHLHGFSGGQFSQTRRFGFKHRQTGSGIDLDEESPLTVTDTPCLIDAATTERLALADDKSLASDCVEMMFKRSPKMNHRASLMGCRAWRMGHHHHRRPGVSRRKW